MLTALVQASVRARYVITALFVLLIMTGGLLAKSLPIDALPDVSTVQVSVLTDVPGMSAVQVEQAVTFPVETALNGIPGLAELRSVSRAGLSVVTIVLKDGTDPWAIRPIILERVRTVESNLPPNSGKPELSPVVGGLGDIFQFVVHSPGHSAMQLRTLLDWEIVPKLRAVPGVIEVNTMGGELKEYQVVADRARLRAYGMSLADMSDALKKANVSIGGGYLDREAESFTFSGIGQLRSEEDVKDVFLKAGDDGTPVLVRHVAAVRIGPALRYGVTTQDGVGEVVSGTALMLTGSNSRKVLHGIQDALREIREELPPGVQIDTVYDRSDFVGRTLSTVGKNLAEGALVVLLVLWLILGSFRGALVVTLGIPASMTVALAGMHLFGVPGDLMSLGAIDFGFLVDGPIVMLEAVMAATAAKAMTQDERTKAYASSMTVVARPVAFAVTIIMLVYVPLLSLEGVEGKMFKPMALTMACALFGALVYSVLFFPGMMALLVPPPKGHGPKWVIFLEHQFAKVLPWALAHRGRLFAGAAAALVISGVLVARQGADFLPRIDEGDLVVTIRRAPSISLGEAKRLDLAAERVLKRYPEVVVTLGKTGRAELAMDSVGSDSTDIFVHLKPKTEWTTASDLDGLALVLKNAIESEVAGTFVSVSQPIEDKTNELISGSRADVQISIFGDDRMELKRYSEELGRIARAIPGTGDLRVERLLGAPTISVRPDSARLARYGVRTEDALAVVEAARLGARVGTVFEGQKRFDIKLMSPPRETTPEALGELFVESSRNVPIPLSEIATIQEEEGPTQVRRIGMRRTVRVEVNLRGRDLISWVGEAKAKVSAELHMPASYDIVWGGQFENFERAQKRLGMVVPIAMLIIYGMLYASFGSFRFASAVFALVPFALTGGMLGLVVRDLPFSIPAAVGFIALAGVCVLNGVVLATEVKRRLDDGQSTEHAIRQSTVHTARAVVTTGAVAALGFFPMALATGAGAEVQRPLATVVVAGVVLSTALTLFVLPGILTALIPRTPVRD